MQSNRTYPQFDYPFLRVPIPFLVYFTYRVFGCGMCGLGWLPPSFWDGADPSILWLQL
jgi:hypothetical protein